MQYVYLKWGLYIVVVLVFVWMVTGETTEQKVESSSPSYYEKYYETATKDFKTRPGVKFSKKEKSGTAVSLQEGSGRLEYKGFTYKTVVIGTQEWTVDNLRTTTYNDGSPIENVTDNEQWGQTRSGAYCAYENDESNVATYGYLYNWYAVNTGKLAPATEGWRVPTDADWTKLTYYIGREDNAGTKLKARSGWSNNGNGSDEYGFSALPGGGRDSYDGSFYDLGSRGDWWSSTANGSDAWHRGMDNTLTVVYRLYSSRSRGFSLRLVRDL